MNRSKLLLAIIMWMFIASSLFSQNDNFFSESMKEADEYIKSEEYSEALYTLNDLVNSGKGNPNIEYKIGFCYLNLVNGKEKAVIHLEKAVQQTTGNYDEDNPNEASAPLRSFLFLGDAYKLCTRLKDAEATYKKYLDLMKGNEFEQLITQKRILECHITQLLMKTPVRAKFEKLGPEINQGIANFNPCISGDGKSLVFNRKTKFYDGIFYCTLTDGGWSEPKEIITQLGSDGDFYPTALSYDGKKMLLSSFHPGSGTDIYESRLKPNGKWQKIKPLDELNSAYHDNGACYSPDDKFIFFSSNRSGGVGGFDIYKAAIKEDGSLGKPENLGKIINSEWDEKFPIFMEDGKTLIFSSDRKPGLGGLDFFYSRMSLDGEWKDVYNIGYPVSTVANDAGMTTLQNTGAGVIARYDPESGAEQDIFKTEFTIFSRFKLVPVSGSLNLRNDNFLVNKGTLFFIDETIEDTVAKIEKSGETYQVELYPGKFEVLLKSGNQQVSSKMEIPSEFSGTVFPVVNDFSPVNKTQDGKDTIRISDILFAFNESGISKGEMIKLEALTSFLKQHSISKIELMGFTDNIGNEKYNLKLSLKRAQSVQQYLVRNGVSSKIIMVRGLGGSKMIALNINPDGSDNPLGRSYNRRVEIILHFPDQAIMLLKQDQVPENLKP